MNKMVKNFILLLLASTAIVYLVFISTLDFYFVNKTNWSVMAQAVFEYYRDLIINQSFGMSMEYPVLSVNDIVSELYGKSLKIIIPAFIISFVLGIILGIIRFIGRDRKTQNKFHKINHLFFGTVPDFFLLITVQFGIILLIRANLIELDLFGDETWFHLLFPTAIISITPIFYISNITYQSLMTEKDRDYVRTAMSKGINQQTITLKHLLWNAWPTIFSYTQTLMLIIISSLPIIERLCFYRGAGHQLIVSLQADDAYVVLGLLLPLLLLVLITVWITDIIKLWIIPISLEQELSESTIQVKRFKRVKWLVDFIKSIPYKTVRLVYSFFTTFLFNTLKLAFYVTLIFPFKIVKRIYFSIVTLSFLRVPKRIFSLIKEYPSFALGIFILAGIAFMALLGPSLPFVDSELKGFRVKYDENMKLVKAPVPPGDAYWFGTDQNGRDLFSIIVHGAKETLMQLLIIVVIRFFISIPLGYFSSINRGTKTLLGFSNSLLSFLPTLILVMLIGNLPSLLEAENRYVILLFVIALLDIGRISEIIRQEFIKINKTEYLVAAVTTGTNWYNLITRHYIPNIYQKIIFIFISDMARIMVLLGGLGIVDVFLSQDLQFDPTVGLTVVNLTFTWPSLLSDSLSDIHIAPWIPFFPSLFIAITIIGLNLFGEGLKNFTDKQKKKKIKQQQEVEKVELLSLESHKKHWDENSSKKKISV
ncbi:ABC transporter permease subunit [Bacillus luteolus]|uniref:ABC transporter permease subunit n=2 Tax=Litchfieldia luteola TaxID=682179 RepID=A0ABR9QEU2_9BACI|nr:ABC transporter permease subunit [Cytobacillus luteolus]MBP1940585.1 ABC-type dipeptide/oligopeptide/nickel transport system permease subunit [Cytobacillus luteolus]